MLSFAKLRGPQVAAACLGLTLFASSQARADIIHADDVLIQFSLCVGKDCVNGENFSFDTIRLKENNLRIMFVDTSTGTFSSRDWQLVANSSASGGESYFGIHDCGTADAGGSSACGTRVFAVTGGAAANSIYVGTSGRVGFGTATPVLNLHARNGNTPGLRLEQDGSSGFTPQTWDIAGNEANFFVRDVTAGSRLPFRIRPGAPTSSIDIANSGFVGIGTANPLANLHVVSGGNTSLQLESTGAGATKWSVSTLGGGSLIVKDMTSNTFPIRLRGGSPNDSLDIRSDGTIRLIAYPNCGGLQTNAAGVISCAAAGGGSLAANAAGGPLSAGLAAGASHPSVWASLGRQPADAQSGAGGNRPGSAPGSGDPGAADTCGAGDLAGNWSLVGANIESFGANSVLWCDVELTQTEGRRPSVYSISGNCRSHVPNQLTPENFTLVGRGSIAQTASCGLSGKFNLKQGDSVVTSASILEGRIEGAASRKTRAVAVSRWRRGRASAIQTFVMQR